MLELPFPSLTPSRPWALTRAWLTYADMRTEESPKLAIEGRSVKVPSLVGFASGPKATVGDGAVIGIPSMEESGVAP